jgi:hypothetical protein
MCRSSATSTGIVFMIETSLFEYTYVITVQDDGVRDIDDNESMDHDRNSMASQQTTCTSEQLVNMGM